MFILELYDIVDRTLEDPKTFCNVCHSPLRWVGIKQLAERAYDLSVMCSNGCKNKQTKLQLSIQRANYED